MLSAANGPDDRPARFQELLHLARWAAFPAGEGDVGMEGAALVFEADPLAGPFDPGGERGQ